MNDDARRLPASAQEEQSKQPISMWKQQIPREEIDDQVSVHLFTTGNWIRLYQAGSIQALGSRRRGRRDGVARQLSSEQEQRIQQLLADKPLDQLKLKCALWR